MRRIGNGSPPAGSRMTREATTRMKAAAATKPTKAPSTLHRKARPSSRIVFAVEKPTSKLAWMRNRRRPLAEPTNTA